MAVVMRGSFLWKSDRVNVLDWMNEWMNECMDWLLFVCVCVYVRGWLVCVTCLQGGAVSIYSGEGTFTNCNFTSNSAGSVSLEEEHVDGCMWSICVHDDAEVVPSIYVFLTDWLIPTFSIRLLWLFPVIGDRSWCHSLFCTVVVLLLFLCLCVYICSL